MASTGSSSSHAAADAAPPAAEIVVGLTSHNDAATVGSVVSAVREGLARHFDGVVHRIVLADAGSTDDTRARAREAAGAALEIVEAADPGQAAETVDLPYHGFLQRARALRGLLKTAGGLDARVCVAIDANLQAIGPQWIERLAGPVLRHDFDFVTPHYLRHVHDGALTKGIVYPVFRSLFGVRLRQPMVGEFACSRALLASWLDEGFWEAERAQSGVDLRLTIAAASHDFRIGEVALGAATHRARGDHVDLATTVAQVVGTLFDEVTARAAAWQRVRESVPVQQFGEPSGEAPGGMPDVDLAGLLESFRFGYQELQEVWTWILPARSLVELGKLARAGPDAFRLPDDVWARIIYDFAMGYRLRVIARDHLLRSLAPLYLGWLASFLVEVRELGAEDVEQRLERLAVAFEAEKPYLIARWRWPERFRT
jgi:hypothetical protein